MRLRPGQLFQEFTVEKQVSGVSGRGRAAATFAPDTPPVKIKAVLADATLEEKERWKQMQHPITHTIIQKGAKLANEGDRLALVDRHFYIKTIENPGGLNMWTLYRAEERSDA